MSEEAAVPTKKAEPAKRKDGGIYKKLNAVMKKVEHMEKAGFNSNQNYNYLSETQIAETFKKLFEEEGIFFVYSSEITNTQPSPSGKQMITDVRIVYEFVDIETGETVTGFAAGQGSDTTDKGVYKAITGAVKYIFMKTFLIPTGDDPEKDTKPGRASRASQVSPEDIPFPSEEDED